MDEARKPSQPATRSVGVGLLVLAALMYGVNALLLRLFKVYLPVVVAAMGPVITLGVLTLIHPRFMDALAAKPEEGHPRWMSRVAMLALLGGLLVSIYLYFFRLT